MEWNTSLEPLYETDSAGRTHRSDTGNWHETGASLCIIFNVSCPLCRLMATKLLHLKERRFIFIESTVKTCYEFVAWFLELVLFWHEFRLYICDGNFHPTICWKREQNTRCSRIYDSIFRPRLWYLNVYHSVHKSFNRHHILTHFNAVCDWRVYRKIDFNINVILTTSSPKRSLELFRPKCFIHFPCKAMPHPFLLDLIIPVMSGK